MLALALAAQIGLSLTAEAGEPKNSSQLKPGMPAPVFRLRALDGAMVRLDELAYPGKEKSYAKKRPVLLDFFRTDCVPCKNALPDLVKTANRVQSQGVDVILVALLEDDDGRGKLERFLAEAKLPLKIVVDEAQLFAKKYLGDPVTLPATFLIDQEGTIVKSKYGAAGTYEAYFGEDLDKEIAKRKGAPSK
jgi:peroxiredoxin